MELAPYYVDRRGLAMLLCGWWVWALLRKAKGAPFGAGPSTAFPSVTALRMTSFLVGPADLPASAVMTFAWDNPTLTLSGWGTRFAPPLVVGKFVCQFGLRGSPGKRPCFARLRKSVALAGPSTAFPSVTSLRMTSVLLIRLICLYSWQRRGRLRFLA